MKPIDLNPEGQFSLGGESFVVDISEGRDRRPSDSNGGATDAVMDEASSSIFDQILSRGKKWELI